MKKYITIGILVLVAFFGLVLNFSGKTVADSEVEDLQSKKAYLEQRVEESKQEYKIAAFQASELREQLELIESKLKRLNATNNERRAELRIIDRQPARFLVPESLE